MCPVTANLGLGDFLMPQQICQRFVHIEGSQNRVIVRKVHTESCTRGVYDDESTMCYSRPGLESFLEKINRGLRR